MFALLLLRPSGVTAQDEQPSKFAFKGYVKYLHTVNFQDVDDEWITDNLFHNRFDVNYYPSGKFTVTMGMRNRLFYGEAVKTVPGYDNLVTRDNGYFNLSFNLASGNSYVLNTSIDRLYVDYMSDKWQITLGRHRINWGQNLIWNPNDVFNAYSYFDFDYEERPGTDALRVQYYTGYTSAAEFVYQLGDNVDDMSFMGLYKFSKWNYDIQFLGGVVKQDVVIGTGWSGDIKGGGFRGEFSYFHHKDSLNKNVGQLVASVSGDYTFKSSLYLHAGILFNSIGTTGKAGIINPNIFFQTSAKYLTLSRASLFAQAGYQLTPLLRADLAGILNPYDNSFYIGPSLVYSLDNNLELLFVGQFFGGDEGTEFGGVGKIFNMRFKWSF